MNDWSWQEVSNEELSSGARGILTIRYLASVENVQMLLRRPITSSGQGVVLKLCVSCGDSRKKMPVDHITTPRVDTIGAEENDMTICVR